MAKQHVIIVRRVAGPMAQRGVYYIRDNRGRSPEYASFDVVSRDENFTVAPNRTVALEVSRAYQAWRNKFLPAGAFIHDPAVVKPVGSV